MRRWTALIAAISFVLGLVPIALARQSPTEKETPSLVLGTDLVLLDVSVTDATGRPIAGIARDRFAVSEDGVKQDVAFFGTERAPASIALVLDTSASMRSSIDRTAAAATRLLDGARPGDEFAVVEFRDSSRLVSPFTSDTSAVREALGGLEVEGQTAMLDALYSSADYVHRTARNRLKAIVLVTDGLDRGSFFKASQVVEHLRALDVRVYLVGLTTDLDVRAGLFTKSEKKQSESLLSKLALETGGRAFFPSRAEELASVDDAIASDVRSIYFVGYYPTNDARDGTYRRVDVRIAGGPKGEQSLTVRTRPGYVAASN